ncbi:unnamed protein product [Pleuronectes platessa]|uniref:Uncharacterized protein n=1 Tax=Pleuronectes platessa TaxID=8262 RepID=A0A9N7U126_PLEPL|nr:unnamed protein product [Pleuronectes platessa]
MVAAASCSRAGSPPPAVVSLSGSLPRFCILLLLTCLPAFLFSISCSPAPAPIPPFVYPPASCPLPRPLVLFCRRLCLLHPPSTHSPLRHPTPTQMPPPSPQSPPRSYGLSPLDRGTTLCSLHESGLLLWSRQRPSNHRQFLFHLARPLGGPLPADFRLDAGGLSPSQRLGRAATTGRRAPMARHTYAFPSPLATEYIYAMYVARRTFCICRFPLSHSFAIFHLMLDIFLSTSGIALGLTNSSARVSLSPPTVPDRAHERVLWVRLPDVDVGLRPSSAPGDEDRALRPSPLTIV